MSSPRITSDDSDREPMEEEELIEDGQREEEPEEYSEESEEDLNMEDPEEDPEENPEEESEEEPQLALPTSSPSPATRPTDIPLFTSYIDPVTRLRMRRTPRKSVCMPRASDRVSFRDPYLPPSPVTARPLPDDSSESWVSGTLSRWRQQERNLFGSIDESSPSHPLYPITGEPPHHTIPLLIARIAHHESRIDLLRDDIGSLPATEFHDELERDVLTLGRDYRRLRADFEQIQTRVVSNSRRMDYLENELMRYTDRQDRHETLAAASREETARYFRGDHPAQRDPPGN